MKMYIGQNYENWDVVQWGIQKPIYILIEIAEGQFGIFLNLFTLEKIHFNIGYRDWRILC